MRAFAVFLLCAACAMAEPPRFNSANQLEFPKNYREWIFLSSGRGMTYGPAADPNGAPQYDNVFVNPEGYREFVKSGKWPSGTVFVLEIRKSLSEGSINKAGSFQGGINAIEIHLKDTKRFKETGGWAFFQFNGTGPAAALPNDSRCQACHSANGAVDDTFVQFYPTLIDIAKSRGTYKAQADQRR